MDEKQWRPHFLLVSGWGIRNGKTNLSNIVLRPKCSYTVTYTQWYQHTPPPSFHLLRHITLVGGRGRTTLCPFAVYYLRYTVTSFFKLSRISLCTFYPALLKSATQIVNNHSFCFSHQTDLGEETEGFGEGGIREGEIGKGQIEEGGCE